MYFTLGIGYCAQYTVCPRYCTLGVFLQYTVYTSGTRLCIVHPLPGAGVLTQPVCAPGPPYVTWLWESLQHSWPLGQWWLHWLTGQYSSTAVQQYISSAVQQCSCTAVQYYCCTADHHSQFPYTVKTCHQLLKYRHCIVGNPCIKSQFLDVPCTNVLNLSKILLCFMNIRPAAFLRDSSATAHRH